jgi:uncharacterized YigZ family protein
MSETLLQPVRFDLEVKKSLFRCQAAAVESPEQALAFLHSVQDHDATHNCWAYRIGQQYRFSDDGEPGGTAGRPILAAIDGQGLDGVMAVVTRWFGGTKLGAGGLVRAYSGAAAECLRTAARRTVIVRENYQLRCKFEHLGSIHLALQHAGALKAGEQFDADGAILQFALPAAELVALQAQVRDISRGHTEVRSAPTADPA